LTIFVSDLGAGSEDVKKIHTKTFVGNFSGTTTKTELHTVGVSFVCLIPLSVCHHKSFTQSFAKTVVC